MVTLDRSALTLLSFATLYALPHCRDPLTGHRTRRTRGDDKLRRSKSPLGLLLLLRSLHAVLTATLLAIRYAAGIESTADDVVAHTGEILHTTTTHEHDRVLLEVVTLTGDIAIDLPTIRQTDTRHLPHR